MKTVTLTLNSVKKHSVRYDADNAEGFVSSVYVMKRALEAPFPEKIKLTLEVE